MDGPLRFVILSVLIISVLSGCICLAYGQYERGMLVCFIASVILSTYHFLWEKLDD